MPAPATELVSSSVAWIESAPLGERRGCLLGRDSLGSVFSVGSKYHWEGTVCLLQKMAVHLSSSTGAYINNDGWLLCFAALQTKRCHKSKWCHYLKISLRQNIRVCQLELDGEVTALAGSMTITANLVLDVAMLAGSGKTGAGGGVPVRQYLQNPRHLFWLH